MRLFQNQNCSPGCLVDGIGFEETQKTLKDTELGKEEKLGCKQQENAGPECLVFIGSQQDPRHTGQTGRRIPKLQSYQVGRCLDYYSEYWSHEGSDLLALT